MITLLLACVAHTYIYGRLHEVPSGGPGMACCAITAGGAARSTCPPSRRRQLAVGGMPPSRGSRTGSWRLRRLERKRSQIGYFLTLVLAKTVPIWPVSRSPPIERTRGRNCGEERCGCGRPVSSSTPPPLRLLRFRRGGCDARGGDGATVAVACATGVEIILVDASSHPACPVIPCFKGLNIGKLAGDKSGIDHRRRHRRDTDSCSSVSMSILPSHPGWRFQLAGMSVLSARNVRQSVRDLGSSPIFPVGKAV